MKKLKILIVIVLTSLCSTSLHAQLDNNIKAKLYYTEAEKTFAQGDFESSLEYILKAEESLGTVVARTLALKVKIQFNVGNFIEAKNLIDDYTGNYMDGANQALNDEILAMYISIEEAAEAEAVRKAEIEASIRRRSGVVKDSRDGKTYPTIKIGTQVWMAENLNYRTGSGSWCYGNSSANCEKYGRLYNWETARRACPSGWHLPSDREWTVLTEFLGGTAVAGTKMKSTNGWFDEGNGTNESGFSGLPGGDRPSIGSFFIIGKTGNWWSSDESTTINAFSRLLYHFNGGVNRVSTLKGRGLSVRCLRD